MMGLLSSIFTFAVDRKLCPDNPCIGIKKPKGTKKTRRLSNAEYHQLGLALKDGNKSSDIFMLPSFDWYAILRSAPFEMVRSENMERGTVILDDTKTGRSIRPLSKAAIDLIKAQLQVSAPYVFEQDGKLITNLTRHWKVLGMLPDCTPHTLRHSFASLGRGRSWPSG